VKIVEVCGYYAPHIGGIEYVAKNVAMELAASGHEVTVLTSTIGSHSAGTVTNGRLKEVYLRGFEFAHTTFMPSLPIRLIKLDRNSMIHLHLSHVYTELTVFVIAKLRRIPYVAHYHMDVDTSGRFGFLYKAYKKALLPFVVRGANKLIALSDEQRTILIQRYGADSVDVTVVPNGVSNDYFLHKKRDFRRQPLRLLYLGRFAEQKNLSRLMKTMPLLTVPVELHLVGGGEKQAELEALVSRLDLKNVYFDGPKTGRGVVEAYRDADVFVLTSNREGMPLVLLEAAAAGLPIVASNVQGLREFIRKNGVLVDHPSPETFAAVLNSILTDTQELERLSKASTKWAKAHTWSKLTKQIEQVLKDAR